MTKTANRFSFKTSTDTVISGYFNLYQARNGKIYLTMANNSIPLSKSQVDQLGIDLYNLEDFNSDDFNHAYAEDNQ